MHYENAKKVRRKEEKVLIHISPFSNETPNLLVRRQRE